MRSDIEAKLKKRLLALTWDELREWSDARSVERGRGYLSRVEPPVLFPDGGVVAEVHGSDTYYAKLRVDAFVLSFLETGRASVEAEVRWPLPRTGLPSPKGAQPNLPALLEIALEEKRGTDVWSLYEQLRREAKGAAGGYGYSGNAFGWRVADAVAKELPEEALKIWDGKIRANVASAHESCYQTICKALEKMRPVMVRLGKGDDWKARVAELRTEYKRRSKFTAMLDALTSGRGASSRIADW